MNNRLPSWFRQELPGEEARKISRLFSKLCVHTVCREARCPNINLCFKNKKATFLILGNVCTRGCRFCSITKHDGRPLTVDTGEPLRVAEAIKLLGLDYAVITSVTRDDLSDGGAELFAQTLEQIRRLNNSSVKIEVLIPDFNGNEESIKKVVRASPDLIGHNIETVKRLYPELRPQADYWRSLDLLHQIKLLGQGIPTKSSLMLGMGETEEEVIEVMKDLRRSLCDCLYLGQYLTPSFDHYPVKEFLCLEQFEEYRITALNMGFKALLCAPLVRSSYRAEIVYRELENV